MRCGTTPHAGGNAELKRFKDDQPVQIHDGDEFVSIRQRAEGV